MNKPFYGAASMTCSNRSQLINIDYSQGPGSYDVNKQKYCSSLPKWTLKPRLDYASCFRISKELKPSPGSYQLTHDIKHTVKLINPNYRSQKYKTSNQKIAHMSNLNLGSSINTHNGTSFGYRDQTIIFKDTTNSPGPIYHVDKNIQQIRSNKIKNNCKGFGFGQRNGIYKTNYDVPGPGAYKSEQKQNHTLMKSPEKSSFGKSPRTVYHNTSPLGPGQYSPTTTNNGKLFSNSGRCFKLKGKLPQASKYINPNGPGTYDLPDTKCKLGPRFNHSRYKSNTSQQIELKQLPSPFSYDCKRYPQQLDQGKGFSLGRKTNSQCNLVNRRKDPGPGAYQISTNISSPKLGGYMGRKVLKKKKINQDDCFGKYDPKISISARQGVKYSFSNDLQTWNKQVKQQVLGPGFYSVKQSKTIQSYSMGRSQRFKRLKKQGVVGYRQFSGMNSTIGYLPSYLRKQNRMIIKQKIGEDVVVE